MLSLGVTECKKMSHSKNIKTLKKSNFEPLSERIAMGEWREGVSLQFKFGRLFRTSLMHQNKSFHQNSVKLRLENMCYKIVITLFHYYTKVILPLQRTRYSTRHRTSKSAYLTPIKIAYILSDKSALVEIFI